MKLEKKICEKKVAIFFVFLKFLNYVTDDDYMPNGKRDRKTNK